MSPLLSMGSVPRLFGFNDGLACSCQGLSAAMRRSALQACYWFAQPNATLALGNNGVVPGPINGAYYPYRRRAAPY
jgi:hypothetical protein